MRIRKLIACVVRLPFKRPFAHASAEREQSENVLVRCELQDGTLGWGEGVPRSYVTGETPRGCLEQLRATPLENQIADDCTSWHDVVRLCDAFSPRPTQDDPRACYGNALRCAVELSVLDAFGKAFGEPLSRIANHVPEARPVLEARRIVHYSAVIDSGSRGLRRKALARRLYRFRHCKVKVGRAGDDDVARLRAIRRWIGPRVDLRLDANEAWRAGEVVEKVRALRPFGISCIEQPVAHTEVAALGELRAQLDVPVMLDESLTSLVDAEAAVAGRTCDLFNIRLSKCGGYLASLRLAAVAHRAGLGYQLGCHPGETGILSSAGRHWACSVANVRYVEGSYDRFLFKRRLTRQDMTFGYGGRAAAIDSPGLGVAIDDRALEEATVLSHEFPVT